MSEADIQDLNPPIFSQWCSTSSTTKNNSCSTWRASSLSTPFMSHHFLFGEGFLSQGLALREFLICQKSRWCRGARRWSTLRPLIPSGHNWRHNSDHGRLRAFGSLNAPSNNSNSSHARLHWSLCCCSKQRPIFKPQLVHCPWDNCNHSEGCCFQRLWSGRDSNKCSAYNTSGLKQKGAKTCLITIEAKAWCDCHWGKWYCSSCSHNFSFTRKRSNGWYCTKAQCCTNLYGVSNKRRIKRWNLRLVILCVKILTSSDAIAIPNMCLFSPQTQLFVKFFSMQKRRSREKVDFATKQREWQQ